MGGLILVSCLVLWSSLPWTWWVWIITGTFYRLSDPQFLSRRNIRVFLYLTWWARFTWSLWCFFSWWFCIHHQVNYPIHKIAFCRIHGMYCGLFSCTINACSSIWKWVPPMRSLHSKSSDSFSEMAKFDSDRWVGVTNQLLVGALVAPSFLKSSEFILVVDGSF